MSRPPYSINWARSALRALDRIPEKAAVACIEFIYGPVADNPHRAGRALRFELTGKHSARRGDFRIIYEIDDEERTVCIVTIEHRSDVYRPR